MRYDTLNNARFEESPLVTSRHYFAAGFALSWILGESRTRVEVPDLGLRPPSVRDSAKVARKRREPRHGSRGFVVDRAGGVYGERGATFIFTWIETPA